MNVVARLEARARAGGWSSRCAYHVAGGRSWTHAEVHELAARMAGVLAARGLGPGERLLLALPDGVGCVAVFLAVARLGALAVTVNAGLPPADHRRLVADCQPLLVVTGPALADRFDPARWIGIGWLQEQARTTPPAAVHPVDDDAALYVQYTSGTTGEPKGAVHRHGDLPCYHRAVAEHMLAMREDDVSFSVSKLFFAYGFGNSLVYPLHSGSSAVLLADRPAPGIVAEVVRRYSVTVLHGVPSAYAHLVAEADPAAFGSVRVAVSAGEQLAVRLCERASELLAAPVLDELGSTEIGGACCANSLDRQVPGTIGFPLPGYELELRDALGGVPESVAGDLWVRGPTLLTGYLNQPPDRAEVVVDGWLKTGDRAIRNRDGSYTHVGRVDDMEMVGGITVAPMEVEHVLSEHPAVREVGVAAVPDERGASKLRAYVVPRNRTIDQEALPQELLALARARLAPFKVPRQVKLVPELPRTATGKLRRFALRQGDW